MTVHHLPPRDGVGVPELPAELQAELEVAMEVAAELARNGRTLDIRQEAMEHLRIELADADGQVLRVLRPTEALDLAAGRLTI